MNMYYVSKEFCLFVIVCLPHITVVSEPIAIDGYPSDPI